LQVNCNTVVNALVQLVAEGYLTGHSGSGTFVGETITRSSEASESGLGDPMRYRCGIKGQ
jgi:DNA-binding GntR family transcriptional regulator